MLRPLHWFALKVFGALPKPVRTRIVRILYPTFTAGTGVVLVNKDGQVLLVTQSYTDDWSLPGGLMGRKEIPADTAMREIREELHIDIDLHGRAPLAIRTTERKHFTLIFRYDLDPERAAAIEPQGPEITAAEWFDPSALPPLMDDTELYIDAVGLTS